MIKSQECHSVLGTFQKDEKKVIFLKTLKRSHIQINRTELPIALSWNTEKTDFWKITLFNQNQTKTKKEVFHEQIGVTTNKY